MGLYPSGGVYPSGPAAPAPTSQSPLTSHDLQQARVDLDGVLPGTAVLWRAGTVSDGRGGWVDSWTAQGTCSAVMHPLGGQRPDASEERYAEQLRGRQGYILTVPAGETLDEAMRVTYEGTDVLVVGVTEWGPNRISRRAIVVRTD